MITVPNKDRSEQNASTHTNRVQRHFTHFWIQVNNIWYAKLFFDAHIVNCTRLLSWCCCNAAGNVSDAKGRISSGVGCRSAVAGASKSGSSTPPVIYKASGCSRSSMQVTGRLGCEQATAAAITAIDTTAAGK